MSSYRKRLDEWLATLDLEARSVLDIGGSQSPIKGRTKSWEVTEYRIADLPNPHKGSQKPDLELDMNHQLSIHDAFRHQSDVVFCLEVFEYVYDPVAAFNNLSNLTKVGGRVYATFPSVYPLHQPVEDDSLRYMPSGIHKLAQRSGLVVADMIPRRFDTNAWQQLISAEGMRAAKGEDHNFSGWIVEFRK